MLPRGDWEYEAKLREQREDFLSTLALVLNEKPMICPTEPRFDIYFDEERLLWVCLRNGLRAGQGYSPDEALWAALDDGQRPVHIR